MANLLDQLSAMTIVVVDTGDLQEINKFAPRDATTNPSLILAAAQIPSYQNLIDETLISSRLSIGKQASMQEVVNESLDQLCVRFGTEILKRIPGRVSTEVDARLSYDTEATITKARKLINLYKNSGIDVNRVLIKIAATWEGIKAAEILEKESIHCNLTLLFGFTQAVACAEAGVTLISPFVGRILDWYKANSGITTYLGSEDPGVMSVTKIFNYYKKYGYKTEVMGASFRNIDEIVELAGIDLLTIAPTLLNQLKNTEGKLIRKLNSLVPISTEERLQLDQRKFEQLMNLDRMASEKLTEGILGFTKAIENLELQLSNRLLVWP
uniref:Transaldolase n=1 Tax=Paulinella chromatophora TaxID=39717 RepID=B1X5S8_PAUCH|nr:transaldolase [Paulinella chromatophora]ACB43297.1 transaldolase [Paulinella chromatophora]